MGTHYICILVITDKSKVNGNYLNIHLIDERRMTSFLSPRFLCHLLKSYVWDIDWIWKHDNLQVERYQSKALRRIVQYAATVPLYKQRYCNIHPGTIRDIHDLSMLPFVTKQDFRRYYPQGLVPPGFNMRNAFLVSTSGSTGQPVSLYSDPYTIVKSLMGFIRELREYNISWRKNKITIIVDLTPNAIEEVYVGKNTLSNLKCIFPLKNLQVLHVGDPVEELMAAIEGFQPDFLGGYPGVLRALAVLKRRGMGEHVQPVVMASSGAVLDGYTRGYIERSFGCRLFDVYGSTEAGPVAFECQEGSYHVHADFVAVECVDGEGVGVPAGSRGRMVVTKLYGRGTPVIRYTGMNDVVTVLDEECGCGLGGMVLGEIGGRRVDAVVLPSGRVIPPSAFTGIPGKVMHELGTDKILQFQIVQESREQIDVLVVIDEALRDEDPVAEVIFRKIEQRYGEVFGEDMTVTVKEVKEIKKDDEMISPVVISRVNPGK